ELPPGSGSALTLAKISEGSSAPKPPLHGMSPVAAHEDKWTPSFALVPNDPVSVAVGQGPAPVGDSPFVLGSASPRVLTHDHHEDSSQGSLGERKDSSQAAEAKGHASQAALQES